MDWFTRWALILIWGLVIAAIAATAWLFLYQRDYSFSIEAACDISSENCFHRDCSTGNCPPNNLEDYKVYKIQARDFFACSADTCVAECKQGTAKCSPVSCDASSGDTCANNPEKSAQ